MTATPRTRVRLVAMAGCLAAALGALPAAPRASAAKSTKAAKTASTRPAASYDKLDVPKQSPTLSVVFSAPSGALRTTEASTELRWLFDRPVAELGADVPLDPSPFVTITPPINGEFRWASTRMLVFTPSEDLTGSTSYTATIAGLKALDGTTLATPATLTVTTPRVVCAMIEGPFGQGSDTLLIECDQPVDEASLVEHTSVVYRPVSVKTTRYQPTAADLALMKAADPTGVASLTTYLDQVAKRSDPLATLKVIAGGTRPCRANEPEICYLVTMQGTPPRDAVGRVQFAAGITSLAGPLPSKARTSGRMPTARTPLIVTNGCRTSCDPGEGIALETIGMEPAVDDAIGKLSVQDVTGGTAGATVRFELPTGVTANEVVNGDDEELFKYRSPLAFRWADPKPGHTYRITIEPSLESADGAQLGYRSITTIGIGRSSGFANVRSGERVLMPTASGVRLRSRNVTAIDKVEKVLTKDDLVAIVRSYAGFPKAAPLDLNSEKATRVAINAPLDATKARSLAVGKAGTKGVTLVAVRPATYRAGSHYTPSGRPWTDADEKLAASRRARATKSKSGTGVDGDGWSSVLVQRTDLGVTLKVSPSNVHVSVTSLATSKALKGVKISLYTATGAKPYATGTTDANGFLLVDAPESKVCTTCEIIAIAEAKGDLAYTQSRWRDWGDDTPYYDDVSGTSGITGDTVPGWTLQPGERRSGSMFTDRGVYKLGETVYVKGVVRTQTTKGLAIPKDLKQIELEMTDPQSLVLTKKKVDVSETGSFDTTLKVPLGGAQGSYSISAPGVYGSFLVTSYRKPDFVVDATTKKPEISSGQRLQADVDARYLFGAPMAGAKQTTVLRSEYGYPNVAGDDKELADYSFSFPCLDSSLLDCGPSPYDNDALARIETPLDSVGHLTIDQPMVVTKTRHSAYNVVVETDVEDVSRQTFAARTNVLVHPGTYYYGVKTLDGYATAGKDLRAQIISVTPQGKRVTGKAATVELVRWEWTDVKRTNDDGTTSTVGTYKLTSVSKQSITTAAAPVEVKVTPPAPGMYELRVYGTDELGNGIESGVVTFAIGAGYVAWEPSGDQPTLALEADKKTYAPGDVAHVLIRSPWQKAEGLLTIERGGVLSAKRFAVTSSASSIDVPIDEDATPNEYATITLFGPPPAATAASSGAGATTTTDAGAELDASAPQLLTSMVELSVPPADRELDVKVSTAQKSYLPGVDTSVDVTVADANGKPTASEVTLWAVDEGVLRLTGFTTPDLLSDFYLARSNEVLTSDSRMRLAVIASDEKGDESDSDVAPGGGGGDSATSDGIRTDFRTLAVWSGSVKVGSDGKATVPVKLPQSLTAYRILAVATAGADHFGGTAGSVEVRKPFMLQPAVPRFANVGDTFEAGVVVFNRTGKTGPVTVTATPDAGNALAPANAQTVTVPSVSDKPVEVRFTFNATSTGRAKITFSGQEGTTKTPETSDAVVASFPTTVTQRLAVVATSGTVRVSGGKTVSAPTERVNTPADAIPGIGGLEVAASTSALAGLQNSIASLVEYPYGCLEQRTSRIRVLLELSKLDGTFQLPELEKSKLTKVITTEIRNLRQFSTSEGALSYWPGTDLADPYLTSRTLLLLLDAKAQKIAIPAGMIRALTKSLQGSVGKVTNDNPDESWRYESEFDLGPVRAQAAYALARAGKPESALVDALYDARFDLQYSEQVNLLRAMLEAGETGVRPNTLYRDLLSSVRIESDRASVSDTYSYSDWPGLIYLGDGDNSVVDTGMLLSLMTRTDPKNPLVPKLAKWLIEARSRGTWGNTLESGVALHGLLDLADNVETTSPKITANIALGTTQVLSQQFEGRSLDVVSKTAPIDQTKAAGKDFVASATGDGTLYWSARLRYAVPPARLQALDQGFTIERRYATYVPSSVAGSGSGSSKKAAAASPTGSKTRTTIAPSTTAASFAAGDLVKVTIRITTAQQRFNVAIEDLLPAGFEALNAQLTTTSQENLRNTSEGSSDSGSSDATEGDRSPWQAGIDHTEIRDDRVLLFATRLDAGSFTYTYVARATAPGTFTVPPAQVEEMYHPEVLGRTKAATVVVRPPAS